MPDITPNLGLKKPLGNETVSRAAYSENLDLLDQNAAKASDVAAHLADVLQDGVHGIATTADLTLYVDAALGDDNNTGLAAGAGFALKTIQAAINKIPQIVNNVVTVNVAAMAYAETVSIKGFSGKGTITVTGADSLANAVNYLINNMEVFYNSCPINIKGFKAIVAGTYGEFRCHGNQYVDFTYCITEVASPYGLTLNGGKYNAKECRVSNHTTAGVHAYISQVNLTDCTGSGNAYGVYPTYGGIVNQCSASSTYMPGKRIRGTTANEFAGYGGIISPVATNQNIALYVRPDGSNDNDGSANDAAHALLTISEAIRRLPPRIDHTVTINVAAGNYIETINVQGFVGKGLIQLMGAASVADTHATTRLVVSSCGVTVMASGFKFTNASGQAITITECIHVLVADSKVDAANATYDALTAYRSFVEVKRCSLSNRRGGITSYTSLIYSEDNSGTGNVFGLYSLEGGKIGKGGTQPGGTSAEGTATGGQIL